MSGNGSSRRALAACIVGVAALLAACLALFDQPVARSVTGLDPDLRRVFAFITWFGQGGVILYPTGLFLLLAGVGSGLQPRWRPALRRPVAAAFMLFATVAAAGLVNDALKIVFGRARPGPWLAGDESGFGFFRYGFRFASFPSGHTATSVAAAVALGILLPRFRRVFAALALLIAVSRIVLGMHYPSDVLAGALVGLAAARLVIDRCRRAGILRRATQDSQRPAVCSMV
jgi:undecaprenyl-diphosphatase